MQPIEKAERPITKSPSPPIGGTGQSNLCNGGMTRKHFKAIAEIIRQRVDYVSDMKRRHCLDEEIWAYKQAVHAIASDLSDLCATTNPNFDRDKFLNACGIK